MPTSSSFQERILRRVVIGEFGCWLWQGSKGPLGYGYISGPRTGPPGARVGSRPLLVHRVAYAEWVGPIPDGLVIDHLCRVKHCCNPAHLEAVTQSVNLLRAVGMGDANLAKTHCLRGHVYDETNTYVRPSTRSRSCRACQRIKDRRRRALVKETV